MMNTHAKEGDKVIFTGENGDDYELAYALTILEPNKEYTVYYTMSNEFDSKVCLKEHSSHDFDTQMFEDAK